MNLYMYLGYSHRQIRADYTTSNTVLMMENSSQVVNLVTINYPHKTHYHFCSRERLDDHYMFNCYEFRKRTELYYHVREDPEEMGKQKLLLNNNPP